MDTCCPTPERNGVRTPLGRTGKAVRCSPVRVGKTQTLTVRGSGCFQPPPRPQGPGHQWLWDVRSTFFPTSQQSQHGRHGRWVTWLSLDLKGRHLPSSCSTVHIKSLFSSRPQYSRTFQPPPPPSSRQKWREKCKTIM